MWKEIRETRTKDKIPLESNLNHAEGLDLEKKYNILHQSKIGKGRNILVRTDICCRHLRLTMLNVINWTHAITHQYFTAKELFICADLLWTAFCCTFQKVTFAPFSPGAKASAK